MKIKNKISFLEIDEIWFANENDFNINCMFSLKIYRNITKHIKKYFCFQEKKYTLYTNLNENSDDIFKLFVSNLRNEIRKVDKLDNSLVEFNSIEKNEFIEFYNVFAKSKSLPLLTNRRLEKYKDNLLYISAKLDDELTNIQVYIIDYKNKIVRLLYSVSTIHGLDDKTKRNRIGWINKALHWKSILYFKENNFNIFDWGGYGNDENNLELAGIDKFKKSFGGEVIEVYDYYSLPVFILKKLKELKS